MGKIQDEQIAVAPLVRDKPLLVRLLRQYCHTGQTDRVLDVSFTNHFLDSIQCSSVGVPFFPAVPYVQALRLRPALCLGRTGVASPSRSHEERCIGKVEGGTALEASPAAELGFLDRLAHPRYSL